MIDVEIAICLLFGIPGKRENCLHIFAIFSTHYFPSIDFRDLTILFVGTEGFVDVGEICKYFFKYTVQRFCSCTYCFERLPRRSGMWNSSQ